MERPKIDLRDYGGILRRAAYSIIFFSLWQAASLPLVAGEQFGSSLQYFSQIAVDGGSTTIFFVHNSEDFTILVNAVLYDSSGDTLDQVQVKIPPQGTESLEFGGPGGFVSAGWAQLASDEGLFAATEFFEISGLNRVGVLPSVPCTAVKFFGFQDSQLRTGVAISNPSNPESTTVTVRILDATGEEKDATSFQLGPGQQLARFLDELFPGLDFPYEGTVEVTAEPEPVAVLALTLESDSGNLATVSVVVSQNCASF